MKRSGLLIGSVGGAVAIHVALVACGGMSMGVGGEDGGIVADAAGIILGAETADANAQSTPDAGSVTMAVDCDQQSVATVTNGAYETRTTNWYADLAVPGIDPRSAPRVSVLLCDRIIEPGTQTCGTNQVCTSTGYVLPDGYCIPSTMYVARGHVVVNCWYRLETFMSGAQTAVTGTHYQHAYIRID